MAETTRKLLQDQKARAILVEMSAQGSSDAAIQARIANECGYEYNIETIRRNRNRLELRDKGQTPGRFERVDSVAGPALTMPPPEIAEQNKADWYRRQFRESHLYPKLAKQFTSEEIENYMTEYGQICCQFEDLITSEFFLIDDFLRHRILLDRQMIRMKFWTEEIHRLQTWLSAHPLKGDEDPELKKDRIQYMRDMDSAQGSLRDANDRYDSLVAERQRIYKSLAATRKDRLDDLKGGANTFFALVAQITADDRFRAQQGQYAELTRMAAEDVQEEFRKEITFPDGNKDAIILDENTTHLDRELQALDEMDATEPEPDTEMPWEAEEEEA